MGDVFRCVSALHIGKITTAPLARRLFPALPKQEKRIEGSPAKSPAKALPPASPQPKIVAKVS